MQAYMKEQVKEQKETHANESSEDSDGEEESE
jgi:hypothetical protein